MVNILTSEHQVAQRFDKINLKQGSGGDLDLLIKHQAKPLSLEIEHDHSLLFNALCHVS